METKYGSAQPSRSGGYEHSDASPRTLVKLGLAMAISVAVILVLMKWTFDYFQWSQPLGPPASYLTTKRSLPPSPRLQTEPRVELHDYCTAQMQILGSYGWVDQGNGIVRIPVDRAMDLTLQRGLLQARSSQNPIEETESSAPGLEEPAQAPPANDLYGQCGYVNQWGTVPSQ